MSIKIGNKVPAFSLPSQNGELFDLGTVLGKKPLVIYFYPKDDTPGCTAEACGFRDAYEDFQQAGAEVIGVSSDPVVKHSAFASRYSLPFILLSDTEKKLRKLFGVPGNLFGLLDGRVTYVVDKEGVVRHIFNSQINATKHIDEALKVIKQLD